MNTALTAENERHGLLRELDYRENDGIAVTLLWDPRTAEVSIQVIDDRSGIRFHAVVPAARAVDAFQHPFLYHASPLPPAEGAHRKAVAK